MFNKARFKSVSAVVLLSTAAMASDSPYYTDPLGERVIAMQANASQNALAYEQLKGQFEDSLTPEQVRLQSALDILITLSPQSDKGVNGAAARAVEGTDLDVVILGNARDYPAFLETLLSTEIPDLCPLCTTLRHIKS